MKNLMARQIEDEKATERVQIVATPRWMARVEEWRRKQPKIPTRSDAIRMLVDQRLDEIDGVTTDPSPSKS